VLSFDTRPTSRRRPLLPGCKPDAANSNGAWSEGVLTATGAGAVSKTGTTQFRIYLQIDDNDDGRPDYVGFYSGDNATAANRPPLMRYQ